MSKQAIDARQAARKVVAALEAGCELRATFARLGAGPVVEAATRVCECLRKGGTVFWLGNGGSAADSQHLAAELVGKFELMREPLRSIALTTNTSILTSISNDIGFDQSFDRQVEALVRRGDVVVGISTSGRSANVARALRTARVEGACTIALTGLDPGPVGREADVVIPVPSENTARIQELHITVGHIICSLVEEALFGKGRGLSGQGRHHKR